MLVNMFVHLRQGRGGGFEAAERRDEPTHASDADARERRARERRARRWNKSVCLKVFVVCAMLMFESCYFKQI